MTLKDLKEKVRQSLAKHPPSQNDKDINWVLTDGHGKAKLMTILYSKNKRRVYFVCSLDNPAQTGFISTFRRANRLTIGSLLKWVDKRKMDDSYEVYLAFKYSWKDTDVYNYGKAADNLKTDFTDPDVSKFILTTESDPMEKIKVAKLDESLRKLIYGNN